MSRISEQIEAYTCDHSQFETSRDYISISHCGLTIEEIVNQHRKGFIDSKEIRLRCYKGYQMERDLKERIKATFDHRIRFDIEVSAFDGLVKGHPDFALDENPGDCKTVPLDEHLPKERLPRKVFYQMQGYMLYMRKKSAIVIYESRETGKIQDYWITAHESIQREIDAKFQQVLRSLNLVI